MNRVRLAPLLLSAAIVSATATMVSAQAAWPNEFPPRPLPAPGAMKFPAYEVRTLPNGLQVVAVLHHEQPVVSLRMIVRAGSALDPKGKLGLANVAAALLSQGTTSKTASQLNEEIDFIGGEMGAGSLPDFTLINMLVMKDNFDTGLRLMSDVVRRPAFRTEELERQRQQMLSGLQVSFEDPSFIADAVFNRLVYGFHPYAMPESGTPETLAAITREDLEAYHRQNFVANNAILAVVGDVTADEAFAGVSRIFGDWERREVPRPTFTAPPDPTRRVIVVNKPDAVQTEVRVGHVGVRRTVPDYMPLNLATRILGGEGANRLHQILRTERGLTYGAQADMHTLKDTGDFVAETSTRSDATGEVLRLIIDQFVRLQRERVNDRELSDAKAYMTGSFPLTIETPDDIATQVLNVLFYGLPVEQLQTFRERVNAVSPFDIERVARYYLAPDRLSIVLVGNAAAFTGQLRGLGITSYEVVEMADLDLTTADFRRPRTRAELRRPAAPAPGQANLNVLAAYLAAGAQGTQPAATDAAPAQALLDRVIAAKGGLDVLRGVRTLTAKTKSEMPTPAGPVQAEVTTYLQYPDKVRVETSLPEGAVVQVYDGARGWIHDGRTTREVSRQAARDIEAGFRRDTVLLLLAAHDSKIRARLLPEVKGDDGKLFHALELSGLTLEPMVLYIDPDTHLIARQVYVASSPGQPLVEELFSDYQLVDGIQVAFTARVRSGGQPMLERRVSEIRINPTLDPKLFTRPAS